jgi:hypothetical protein
LKPIGLHSSIALTSGAPTIFQETNVDRDVRAAIVAETFSQTRPERPERADVARGFRPHRAGQRNLGQAGGDVSQEPLLLGLRRPIDGVIVGRERRQHWRNFADRILQVVVHRHNDLMLRGPDAAEKRVVLSVVAAHPDASHSMVGAGQILDDRPRMIAAAVFDEDDLERRGDLFQRAHKAPMEFGQDALGPIDRNNDRKRGHPRRS